MSNEAKAMFPKTELSRVGGQDMSRKWTSVDDKRPSYFRFFLETCDMISLLDVESAGRVIHAVSDYFSENVEPEDLDKNERTVFNRIRRDIDKSFSDYEASVKYGRQGAEKRYGAGRL